MAANSASFGALLRGLDGKKKKKTRTGEPFASKKQQGFMFANHPKIAKKMAHDAKKKGEPVVKESDPSWELAKPALFQERMRMLEADANIDAKKDLEGCMVRCVLITEGLGNKRDRNYYGPEALKSGLAVFEGASAYLNHPTEEEEQIIPERRVEAKCGYFKNLKLEKYRDPKTGTMVNGLCGELHFDLSEAGRCAYEKALTALHYRAEFPDSPYEYVGLSVNADGSAERRTIEVDGERMEVNYVLEFARDASTSCDVVTSPARGGRFLAAMTEDEKGVIRVVLHKEETVKDKLKKLFASARTALKLAESEKDESKRKAKLAEAQAKMKEAEEEAEKSEEAEILGLESFQKKEGESEGEHKERLMKLAAGLKKEMEAYESSEEADDEQDADADDKPEPKKKDMESARLAVKHLISEAALPKGHYDAEDVEDLAKMPLSEARREIKREKRRVESIKAGAGDRMSTRVTREAALDQEDDDSSQEAGGTKKFVESFGSRRGF